MSSTGPTPILIVEDEEEIRRILIEFFTGNDDYHVSSVPTGTDAVTFIDQGHDIGIVLLDITLPGMNGIEVLKHIKLRHPNAAVIVLTSVMDKDIARQAVGLGAFDYVIKPPDLHYLESLVRACKLLR